MSGEAPSLAHQQACADAGSPLGVFRRAGENDLLGVIPAGESPAAVPGSLGREYAFPTVLRLLGEHGLGGHQVDVLTLCVAHPGVGAVDCTDCVPLDADG